MDTALRIQLFGDFCLTIGDSPATVVDSARIQALLAYLTLRRHAPQPRQQIAFLFWPDSSENQARTNLRKLLLHLRQLVPPIDEYLDSEGQSLFWRAGAPVLSDVASFEEALAQAGSADLTIRRHALELAAGLYRGDLLPGCYDDWILPERVRLREAAVETLAELVRLAELMGDPRGAIGHGQRLLQLDPADEEVCRRMMRLYAQAGNRAAAMRVFHTCMTTLQEELGIDPSPATQDLHEQLLHGDVPLPVAQAPIPAPDLIGRETEWQTLQLAWDMARQRMARAVLLWGDPGIGKTRLAEDFLAAVRRQGDATASARCYAAEGNLPYAPVVAWLRSAAVQPNLATLAPVWQTEAARLAPDLFDAPLPAAPDNREPYRRQRLFEALARALCSSARPLLLILDDLHWGDTDTLEWLHFLLRFDPESPLLLIATVRSEEVTPDHPLQRLLPALRRTGRLEELELHALDTDKTAALGSQLAGRPLTAEQASRLYNDTEGNPLFVVEMVRAAVVAGRAPAERDASASPLPPTLQAVIGERLARLSPAAREVASLAATIGRAFSFNLLAHACDLPEDALARAVDELWRRRIIREQGTAEYDFGHDRVREVAQRSLSAAHRRIVHRRIAQALEAVAGAHPQGLSAQIADHFEKAGLAEPAVRHYRIAAEQAVHLFANDDAIRYCRRALALLPAEGSTDDRSKLSEKMGDLLHWTGQYAAAYDAYAAAQAAPAAEDPVHGARLLRKMANAEREQYRYAEAMACYREAQALLHAVGPAWIRVVAGVDDEPPEAGWLKEWIQLHLDILSLHYWLGDFAGGMAVYAQVEPAISRFGTIRQQADLLIARIVLEVRHTCYVISDELYAAVKRIFPARISRDGDAATASVHFMLGFVALWRNDWPIAGEHLHTALDLANKSGDVSLRARALTYLTIMYRRRGDIVAVEHAVEQAFAVAKAAGMPEYTALAHANRAWLCWRRRDWAGVTQYATTALDLLHNQPHLPVQVAFAWTALWPLLAAALQHDALANAISLAHRLLDPPMQPPPADVAAELEAALAAWQADDADATRQALARALVLAEQVHSL
jgi:DNA-binding SARP family transcriptional activator